MTEIFIEPELSELEQPEQAQQWFDIATKLGLSHQLIHASRSDEMKPPPYMHIDARTSRIIKALCPIQVTYDFYRASTIPLDVLEEIEKCVRNKWYSKIDICYDDKSPDPFVIGFTHNDNKWQRDMHLIARWGAELIPFEMLEKKAIDRLRSTAKNKLSELKFKTEMALSDVDAYVDNLLSGGTNLQSDFGVSDISKY